MSECPHDRSARSYGADEDGLCPYCLLEERNKLIEAAEKMPAACSSLMDEITGKRATDWGLVNDALCGLSKALAAVRGEK